MTPRRRTIVTALVVALAFAGGVVAWRRPSTAPSDPSRDEADAPTHGSRRSTDSAERREPDPVAPVDPRVAGQPADVIAATLRAPTIFTGSVVEASGGTPEREGASCRLGVIPTDDASKCRVVLECGHTRIHGDPILHETSCQLADDRSLRALDDPSTTRADRDPALELDAAASTLTVSDDTMGPYGEYRIVVHLEPSR